jgi:hypothetical protein
MILFALSILYYFPILIVALECSIHMVGLYAKESYNNIR